MLQCRFPQIHRPQVIPRSVGQPRIRWQQGEGRGFPGRDTGMGPVFHREGNRLRTRVPAQQHQLSRVRMLAQPDEIVGQFGYKRMRSSEQARGIPRQHKFAAGCPGAQAVLLVAGDGHGHSVGPHQFACEKDPLRCSQRLWRIGEGHRAQRRHLQVPLPLMVRPGLEHREQPLEPAATQQPDPMGLHRLRHAPGRRPGAGPELGKHPINCLFEGVALQFMVGTRVVLAMIGVNPDIIVAAGRGMRRAPQTGDGVIDPLQGPVGKTRCRSAPV